MFEAWGNMEPEEREATLQQGGRAGIRLGLILALIAVIVIGVSVNRVGEDGHVRHVGSEYVGEVTRVQSYPMRHYTGFRATVMLHHLPDGKRSLDGATSKWEFDSSRHDKPHVGDRHHFIVDPAEPGRSILSSDVRGGEQRFDTVLAVCLVLGAIGSMGGGLAATRRARRMAST